MKIVVLETVFNEINADMSLKTNEKEWLYLFQNWLDWVNTNRYSNESITLSSKYLEKLFGRNYSFYERYFISKGWLTYSLSKNGGKSYSAGEKSTEYIVNFPYGETVSIKIHSKTVKNKAELIFTGKLKMSYHTDRYNLNIKLIESIEIKYRELLNRVSVDMPEDLDLEISRLKISLETLSLPNWIGGRKPNNYQRIYKEIQLLKQQIKDLYQEKSKLNDYALDSTYKNFTIDNFGTRVHTSFTRLKKKYRTNIKLNNQELKEVDIVNAQPWFLSNMPGITDKNFKQDCINGDFYEKFYIEANRYKVLKQQKSLTPLESIELEQIKEIRNEVKVGIYRILFGTYQKCYFALEKDLLNKDSLLNKFITLYPSVWKFIQEYNANDYHELSKTLQRMESDLIVFETWANLYSRGIDVLTLHDGLFAVEKDIHIVKQTLEKFILLKGYSMPQFK